VTHILSAAWLANYLTTFSCGLSLSPWTFINRLGLLIGRAGWLAKTEADI